MSILLVCSGWYFIGEKFRSSEPDAADAQLEGGWQAFTPDRLAAELEQGHNVFVDFTAAWCITCKFNEASVLETAAVREAFQQRGRQIEGRLDQRRSGHHKIIATIWPSGCPTLRALPWQGRRPVCVSGVADEEYHPR